MYNVLKYMYCSNGNVEENKGDWNSKHISYFRKKALKLLPVQFFVLNEVLLISLIINLLMAYVNAEKTDFKLTLGGQWYIFHDFYMNQAQHQCYYHKQTMEAK